MISPEKKTIEEILNSSKINFSVPKYQRTFDWGVNELQELIQDLKESKNKNLFLGNFIFDISNQSDYKIVDGQQRLTAISIILISLREQAKKLNDQSLSNEIQNFISTYSKIRNKNELKISVSENIKTIYQHMAHPDWNENFPDSIDGKPVKRQSNKVAPLYKYIQKSLKSFNTKDLTDFVSSLLDSYVVVITVENDEDVFSVFERTNARGLDLNIGDLLKNYIFSHQNTSLEDRWSQIVENADGNLPRLLKYFWVSRKGHIQQSKLYKALKSYVKEIDKPNEIGIDKFVEELHTFSKFYHSTQSPDPSIIQEWFDEYRFTEISENEDYYHRVSRIFQALMLFRITQAYPIIYSIIKAFKNNSLKIKHLFIILETIEKYHFVNNIVSGHPGNEIEMLYAESAQAIYACNDSNSLMTEINRLHKELSKRRVLENEFKSQFIANVTYSKKNIPLVHYVFDRVNNFDQQSLAPVKGSQYVPLFSPEKNLKKRNYNIEHFLPLDCKKSFDEKDFDIFDSIGNLLVISRHSNSEFNHKSPQEKVNLIRVDKKHFGNLRYLDKFLDDYSGQFDNWSLKEIENRSIEFSEEAYNGAWKF